MASVRGWLELPPDVQIERPATAYVRVEDVRRVDAEAVRLGLAVISNLTAKDFALGRLRFTVTIADPPPGARCAVRAHLDLDGDAAVTPGDYVSTEQVLVENGSAEASVRLRKVI